MRSGVLKVWPGKNECHGGDPEDYFREMMTDKSSELGDDGMHKVSP
jgi:hypothetical protein